MQHFQIWFENGWANKTTSTDDDFYVSKTAALSWVGHWMYNPYVQGLGEDLVLLPMPDFGYGPKTGMGSWNWGIANNCQDPGGAWTFIEYLLSPEEILRMTNANGAVPARQSALVHSELYGEAGPLHLFVQQLESERAVPRPITPAYAAISAAFAQAVENIIHGADVQSELTQAAQKIDQDIREHDGYSIR
jgi:multiple sugar transport system substrate-binding protein